MPRVKRANRREDGTQRDPDDPGDAEVHGLGGGVELRGAAGRAEQGALKRPGLPERAMSMTRKLGIVDRPRCEG